MPSGLIQNEQFLRDEDDSLLEELKQLSINQNDFNRGNTMNILDEVDIVRVFNLD